MGSFQKTGVRDRDLKLITLEGENKMTVQDTFNGAKSGLTFMRAYVNTVAQEIGAEKARKSAAATMDLVRSAMGLNY